MAIATTSSYSLFRYSLIYSCIYNSVQDYCYCSSRSCFCCNCMLAVEMGDRAAIFIQWYRKGENEREKEETSERDVEKDSRSRKYMRICNPRNALAGDTCPR